MKIKRTPVGSARIEMLPLIDIVFLLLVFFIYAMLSMAVHRGLELDLPESSQAVQSAESPLSLSIREGAAGPEIFVEDESVRLDEIVGRLKGLSEDPEKNPVLVFAEETITYQYLYNVLDELEKGGMHDISLQASSE